MAQGNVLPSATAARRAGAIVPTISTLDRSRRERKFFNQTVAEIRLEDSALLVPPHLAEQLEPEIAAVCRAMNGKTVCDYGCGWGILSAYFAQCGARVHCFDVAEGNASLARRAARVNRVAGGVFPLVMAGESLAYPDDAFDYLIGNAVLHHVEILRAAPEIYRVLKPGGCAVFAEPLGENRLLEWARHCRLRSSEHRHSPDERSLRLADIHLLARFFDRMVVRETRLLRMAIWALRELPLLRDAGARPIRLARLSLRLERWDDWLLSRIQWLRPLAQYVVITAYKDFRPGERGG